MPEIADVPVLTTLLPGFAGTSLPDWLAGSPAGGTRRRLPVRAERGLAPRSYGR